MPGGDAGGESPLTKRKMVALLAGAIQRARDKGYTLKQIVGQLQNNGFGDCKLDCVNAHL